MYGKLIPNYKDVQGMFQTLQACVPAMEWLRDAEPPIKDLRDAIRRCPDPSWIAWSAARLEHIRSHTITGDKLWPILMAYRLNHDLRVDRLIKRSMNGKLRQDQYEEKRLALRRSSLRKMRAEVLRVIERKPTDDKFVDKEV